MWHDESLDGEWFEKLAKIDERIAIAVAAARCPHCGGPLHRGNYQRKPRGGLIGRAGEAFRLRHSLCCGRRGCRKRALPPSLRFLGRRVYLEAVVLLATVQAMLVTAMRAAQDISGVPARTLRRWRSWWTVEFPKSDTWTVLQARFVPPPPDEEELPKSLLDRLAASLDPPNKSVLLEWAARLLAPVTTRSLSDGSRFVSAALVR
jgi:hypothetical protein